MRALLAVLAAGLSLSSGTTSNVRIVDGSGTLTLPLVGTASNGIFAVGSSAVGPRSPTWCGRKCNCGTGTAQTIETNSGERVEGYVPPSGMRCSCSEVYRCDAEAVGAPRFVDVPSCPSPFILGQLSNGG